MIASMSEASDAVRELVKSKLAEAGLDYTAASLKLGKNRTYMQQYFTKKSPDWLPEEVRPALAAMIGLPESRLVRHGVKHGLQKDVANVAPPARVSEGLIEVRGMAECGPDGWSLWNGEVVDRVPRPPNLAGAPNAYAVFVVGTSMEDRYHPGELAYIHPGKPVTPGSYVLVQMLPKEEGADNRAILKRLVKRSGARVILEQLHPRKTFELKESEIVSIHRVVGSGEA